MLRLSPSTDVCRILFHLWAGDVLVATGSKNTCGALNMHSKFVNLSGSGGRFNVLLAFDVQAGKLQFPIINLRVRKM